MILLGKLMLLSTWGAWRLVVYQTLIKVKGLNPYQIIKNDTVSWLSISQTVRCFLVLENIHTYARTTPFALFLSLPPSPEICFKAIEKKRKRERKRKDGGEGKIGNARLTEKERGRKSEKDCIRKWRQRGNIGRKLEFVSNSKIERKSKREREESEKKNVYDKKHERQEIEEKIVNKEIER